MDWIDGRRAKALRVSNDRETFQLKKIRRSLDSMKTMNDNLLKQEERKVKLWLKRQGQERNGDINPISSSTSHHLKVGNETPEILTKPACGIAVQCCLIGNAGTLFQAASGRTPGSLPVYYSSRNDRIIPSKVSGSYPESSHGTQPASGKESIDITWSQFGDHLPNFVSFLRLPTKRPSYDRKDSTPFSGNDLALQTLLARNSLYPRNSIGNAFPSSRNSWKGSSPRQPSLENSVSLHEAVALFPSLQRLSTKGDRVSFSKPPLGNPVSGFPALQKKLKTMLEKARGDERMKPVEPLPKIRPEEILSCRYLRLSQSNIDTLLDLCRESGVYVDIHPHMKESDINISTVLSSNPSRTF